MYTLAKQLLALLEREYKKEGHNDEYKAALISLMAAIKNIFKYW